MKLLFITALTFLSTSVFAAASNCNEQRVKIEELESTINNLAAESKLDSNDASALLIAISGVRASAKGYSVDDLTSAGGIMARIYSSELLAIADREQELPEFIFNCAELTRNILYIENTLNKLIQLN